MNSRLTSWLVVLGFVTLTGCQKISEPWDTTDYFNQERTRNAEQQKALQHRLASIQEPNQGQPWLHAQH